jgi:hypothetical protein
MQLTNEEPRAGNAGRAEKIKENGEMELEKAGLRSAIKIEIGCAQLIERLRSNLELRKSGKELFGTARPRELVLPAPKFPRQTCRSSRHFHDFLI